MTSSVFRDSFLSPNYMTRQRLESSIDLRKLFAAIDADPAIVGAGVVYIDAQLRMVVLREFQPICSIAPKNVILREAPSYVGRVEFARQLANEPRESQVAFEAVNTALACTSAVISWIVVLSGSALSPFSFGVTGVVAAISFTSATASSIQCLLGGQRARNEIIDPALNDALDSEPWYQAVTIGLDAVSLLGASVSALATIRLVNATRKSTGKTLPQVLKGLSRQERAKLTQELLSIRHPEMTRKMIRLKQLAGKMPKRFTPAEVKQGTVLQIQDALGSALGVASSSMSGNIRTVAVGIYEEMTE